MNLTLTFLSLQRVFDAPALAGVSDLSLSRSKFRWFFHPALLNVQRSRVAFCSFADFVAPALRVLGTVTPSQRVVVSEPSTLFSCCSFTNLHGTNGGAVEVDLAGSNVVARFCEFNGLTATENGGAIYCGSGNMLILYGCRFSDCQAKVGLFVLARPERRLEATVTSFVGKTVNGRDAIRGATGQIQINDINCSSVKIGENFGSGLAVEKAEIVNVVFGTFKDHSAQTCLWFWDIQTDATRVSQIVLLDVTINTVGQPFPRGEAIYSKTSFTVSDSIFFNTNAADPPKLFSTDNQATLTIINCQGNYGTPYSGVTGTLTPLNSYTRSLSWPLAAFTGGNCEPITASPVATASQSPPPTATPSESPSQSPTQSPPPSRSPTSEAEKPPQTASPRPSRSPMPSQSPTAAPAYGSYLGIAFACACFLFCGVGFAVAFIVGEISGESSEATLGRFDGRGSSGDSESASSSTDPLRIRSSSSDDAVFGY